jgi:L-alanine-DL-glutamate epimerase-like enolase superfamily enzyme
VMDNPLRTQLMTQPIRPKDGIVQVPDGPGLGIELNMATIKKYLWTP